MLEQISKNDRGQTGQSQPATSVPATSVTGCPQPPTPRGTSETVRTLARRNLHRAFDDCNCTNPNIWCR